MPVRMKATRAVYSATDRKEFKAGEEFNAPNQREAERLVRRNRAVIANPDAPNPTDIPRAPRKQEAPAPKPPFQEPEADPAAKPRRYARRDLKPEE